MMATLRDRQLRWHTKRKSYMAYWMIRDPAISTDCFRHVLKIYMFTLYYWIQRIRGSWRQCTI